MRSQGLKRDQETRLTPHAFPAVAQHSLPQLGYLSHRQYHVTSPDILVHCLLSPSGQEHRLPGSCYTRPAGSSSILWLSLHRATSNSRSLFLGPPSGLNFTFSILRSPRVQHRTPAHSRHLLGSSGRKEGISSPTSHI